MQQKWVWYIIPNTPTHKHQHTNTQTHNRMAQLLHTCLHCNWYGMRHTAHNTQTHRHTHIHNTQHTNTQTHNRMTHLLHACLHRNWYAPHSTQHTNAQTHVSDTSKRGQRVQMDTRTQTAQQTHRHTDTQKPQYGGSGCEWTQQSDRLPCIVREHIL